LSPALDPGERLRQTERFISYLRLAIVVFNSTLYLAMSPSQTRHGLAWTIIVVANLYALITVFWDPNQLDPKIVPLVNMVLDNVLIAVWLYATGGFSSPFYVLFYAEAAASVGRFGWKVGTASAAGSAALYLAVIAVDGGPRLTRPPRASSTSSSSPRSSRTSSRTLERSSVTRRSTRPPPRPTPSSRV
jgi:hypothetical protein